MNLNFESLATYLSIPNRRIRLFCTIEPICIKLVTCALGLFGLAIPEQWHRFGILKEASNVEA